MRITNRTASAGLWPIRSDLPFCLAFCLISLGTSITLPVASYAQEAELLSRLDQASQQLVELDKLAQSCLQGLDSTQSDSANTASSLCDTFLEAVDGEMLASYIDHCAALKNWRDEFVSVAGAADIDLEEDSSMLQLMIGVEFNCGEGALRKRTQFVFGAFIQLEEQTQLIDPVRSHLVDTDFARRLAEQKFEAANAQYRRQLLDTYQEQNRRIELETRRLSNRLENELIRQQINRANQ